MLCECGTSEVFSLIIEADVDTDPIWCAECFYNLDIEDIPISESLQADLTEWGEMYGNWINWNKDILRPGGIHMENEHNKRGKFLTEKVQKELGMKYKVKFTPSSSAKMYASLNT